LASSLDQNASRRIGQQGADRLVAVETPHRRGRDTISFDPQAIDYARHAFNLELEAELQRAGLEVIAARRQSKARDFPSDESRCTFDAHSGRAAHSCPAEEDALLRQPLDARAGDIDRLVLSRDRALRAIE